MLKKIHIIGLGLMGTNLGIKLVNSGIEVSGSDIIEKNVRKLVSELSHSELNTVYLKQSDFNFGTYRIKTPGRYILQENIVFHPNSDNNFKPTDYQKTNNKRKVDILHRKHWKKMHFSGLRKCKSKKHCIKC